MISFELGKRWKSKVSKASNLFAIQPSKVMETKIEYPLPLKVGKR
jgi:hypothetical protein